MDWKLVGGIGLVGLGLVGLRSQSKRAETFNAYNQQSHIQNLIDDLYDDREIALNKLLKINNPSLQTLISKNALLRDRVGGLTLAEWSQVQNQLKYTPSGRIRTFGAETFDAENGEKVLIDHILKRNNPYFPNKTVITWDTSFDRGWNNMPQAIIEGVDNMNPIDDDEIFLISLTPYEDVEGYGEGHYGAKIVWVDFKGRSQKQFYLDFMKANKGTENEGWFNDSWRVFDGFGMEERWDSLDAETAELLNAEIDMTIEDKDGVIYWMDKDRVQNYFKNWKKDSYPYEVRVMSETKQKWCENCGELDEDDEDSWEHYQSYLKRKNSTKPAFRHISGGGCHGCGMSLCQKCIEGDTTFNGFEPTCEECGYAFCGDCKDDMEDRCNPCQEEYEDSICDCCGYACGNKNAESFAVERVIPSPDRCYNHKTCGGYRVQGTFLCWPCHDIEADIRIAKGKDAEGSGEIEWDGGRMVSIEENTRVNYAWHTDPDEVYVDDGDIQMQVEEKVQDESSISPKATDYGSGSWVYDVQEGKNVHVHYEWDKTTQDGDEEFIKGWGAEGHAYTYAYNDGHSDARKTGKYHPTLVADRDKADFNRVLKQKE